ncbi:hypothetical protein Tco_0012126 [Tanacetum coccineum]
MAVLESCPKHNMVAYLENTDGNTEFHEIISFLTQSSIPYALTVSPVVSTTSVEQFWMFAKSKIINNVRYITAKVVGKPVSISEASIRSHLLFDDADGIDSLPNQAIFDAIQLMGPSPTTHIPDSILEGSGGNHGGQSSSDRSLSGNKGGMTLQSGRKPAKAEPTVHKDPAFDDLYDDTMDYMETEDSQDVGRTSYVVHEEKESAEKGVSNEDLLSTAQPKVSIDKPEDSTDKPDKGTDKPKVSTDKEEVSTDRPDKVFIIMSQNKEKLKEKEKGVELKDVEETERPRPTSTRSLLTLKLLPKIDPKDKGKKMIEEEVESDTDSEDITEAEKKFKQRARDEEVARKARLNADKILAEKLQEEEREMYTIEQRDKFLHDTIVAQRRFLTQQRSEAIRNKPPLRNQFRNRMMTYLKHVGGKKHSDLKTNDEKVIKEMNEQVADASNKIVKKDDSIKGEIKEEEGTRKRKLGIRKKMKSKKRKFTSKDDEELSLCLTIVSDEDKEVNYEILDKKYPIIEWRSEYFTTKPQYDETEEIEDVYLNVVIRSNRQRRYFSTLMAVLSILDKDDIWIHTIKTDEGIVIHMLVENKYPLKKEVLSQLLKLKLETEEDSTMALELIRFVKKQIAELEPEDSDGDETDL